MEIIKWIADNVFGTPSILLGFIVFIGLLLQKKKTNQIISGTFKAIIGFLIIGAGAGVIVDSLTVFEPMWKEVFNLKSESLGKFIGQEGFNAKYGSAVTLAMTIGFLINVFLARLTKFKYIYLTGHMMFWTTTVFAGIVIHTVGDVSFWKLVIFLSIIMGLYWTLQPALTQPFMRKITGNDNIALGHTSASVALMGALSGKVLGNKENDSEKIKLPKGLEFLRDSNVITALTMGTLFLVGAIIVSLKGTSGAEELIKKAGSQNFIIYSIVQSFTFAAGIAVVLMGVRMFIGEIVPAFNGIATKLVPGAKPALDCPIVFPYAPNAVILGFLGAFIGALIWLVIIGSTVGYVFVPTMIVLFFHAATAGVFGNATGGVRGALLGGFMTATVVAWGQYIMVKFLISSTIPDTAMWAADSDMFILGPIIKILAQLFF
ncbi:PTS ascorbate transporter subunit IIC [Saccharococcus caldoxylosilyticus]|uniref:Ascorbate-specific PTS system EIIC component n=1 Tax=Parageobacillus caldoxylosilyticus NBRC 107762 TaxID=1220594 RepID=A0A023DH01_9BACL|nr:PTS ascorbate transporter subunit IIC [Parageobacillus caldoxylosilyticus]MBB3853221.1 PTS system ascorbate-specific IIC component [Parageobacillus caldoxylosilyticus]QNU37518.1 PTS ascorbate transporter subunit IIC [Geobacillus sp. 44B]GAJ40584.1 ascorbate-specific phosphotransferase system enzyme IIC component [Parageobacillus caldoxylosilyticus NBRC 107762]